MYKYIHTTNNTPNKISKQLLDPYVKGYLYSLYNGFTNKTFGFHSLQKLSKSFDTFKQTLSDEILIADSGGYSIIVGDVPPTQISILIDCYNYFLDNYNNYFDYIMSLDIPIFLKYPEYNTTKTIHQFNGASLSRSKNILDKNPDLYKKFIFVWQFKLQKQFNIWRDLYDKIFKDDKKIMNFAIGGLVSLRRITNIQYSPFIAPAYRCIKIIKDKNIDFKFNHLLHILGVYGRHDRFIMQFMDELFNKYYFKDSNSEITISFDTINYTISGLYKVRELQLFDILNINPNQDYKKLFDECYKIVNDSKLSNLLVTEIININKNSKLSNPKFFSLTYVLYSCIIDKQMKQAIIENELLEIFLDSKNFNQLRNRITPILKKLEITYPHAFANITSNILANFYWLSSFHIAWENDADLERFDKGIEYFINDIKFPYDLSGTFEYKRTN